MYDWAVRHGTFRSGWKKVELLRFDNVFSSVSQDKKVKLPQISKIKSPPTPPPPYQKKTLHWGNQNISF